ncbi:hypothetical protein REC12_20585 [Desulfosporosinus sp. PR]|uniref:hypothetical protein n=1 Tax=Candidatus Desulfosporosinus nitrosoreducens TaxID=3401928 RepID=UPI0027EB65B5|nr:hypothetical protein [Desulfosporosinus sp. PR]MDQ7095996.1 hypothetical protein [Desulfosporosinus sp. PR]
MMQGRIAPFGDLKIVRPKVSEVWCPEFGELELRKPSSTSDIQLYDLTESRRAVLL